MGRRREAAALLEEHSNGSLRDQLAARVGVGEFDAAFEVLERVYEARAAFLVEEPNIDAFYDRLRPDPRFAQLLKKMGFE